MDEPMRDIDSALFSAVVEGDTSTVEELLEEGAKPNVVGLPAG